MKDKAHAHVKLKATGGSTGDDARFIKKQKRKLAKAGLLEDVSFTDEYEGETKLSFFNDLTLLTVPVLNGEAFGLYQLEALASGIPIVQPDLGAFPEVVSKTQGGAIFGPNTPEALATKWAEVLSQPEQLKAWSNNGHKAVRDIYGMDALTQKMVTVYESVVNKK
jgi:glycosyltransferase involved in cell wall biosynthesis